ncbi:uncharacterized protein LOC111711390 [Eurytemora carolleeae]|uniref:uncharacterized protein LOC111711390 n=1 Tax=Eurytemora carolleeae TaxID=1294199 RepID=UPI000C783B5D|nr:uncharacterized protein LOC111711390 [Eurytemora carolleeae]|eukprot:XP_023341500.1 uncharacterized protein LOC111711390 [Eurytemora affinis]
MEIEHGRAFLECALTGKKISQSTIMHAYQTCIKRIVRFANSLQDFVELPPEDMHKLLVANTVNMINIRIARWFNPKTNLESQLSLCCTGVDLYKEVSIQHDLDSSFVEAPVNQEDVFVSPWCCDSSYEDRYFALMNSIHALPMDTTSMVLLSVMTLFDSEKTTGLQNFEMILSHEKKFSLLLYREMAEILINKRLL